MSNNNLSDYDLDFSNPIFSNFSLIKKYKLTKPLNVYHYTDLTGFISIMQKQEFWASHISFMNDTSEYIHGKELFREELLHRIPKGSSQERVLWSESLKLLDENISRGFYSLSSSDVFSLSFSYSCNSLELWRGYGKKSGIAIAFDFSKFGKIRLISEEDYKELLDKYNTPDKIIPEHEIPFIPTSVCYDLDKKIKIVNDIIDSVTDEYNRLIGKNSKTALVGALQTLSDLMFFFIPFFKHSGFIGENECRIIVDNFNRSSNSSHDIYYRERNGIILPYIKLKIVDCNCRPLEYLPISEIIVGPNLQQKKVIDSVKYFLEKSGYEELVDKVHASDIPYVEV